MAKLGVTHKKDIKVICPNKRMRETFSIAGFNTYRRNDLGQKVIIDHCPVTFEPSAETMEDGFMVSWVSDTPDNRALLRVLMTQDPPQIMLAEDMDLDKLKERVSNEPSQFEGEEGLLAKDKTELLGMATKMNLPIN